MIEFIKQLINYFIYQYPPDNNKTNKEENNNNK